MAKAKGSRASSATAVEAPPPLRLEYRDVSELADNPRNWRRHPPQQLDALKAVLAEVGWAGACLYNERTGRLIDGHARKAVTEGKVPVLVGSWDEAQEAKILATLDPLAALATADAAALADLLKDVETGSVALEEMLIGLAVAHPAEVARPAAAGPANDPNAEWQGMPEFEHEDRMAHRTLIIHFPDEAAVSDFFARIGQQPVTGKFIWHPKQQRRAPGSMEYVSDAP